MPERERAEGPQPLRLVCSACGHVIGPGDSFVYRVIGGREGLWCPGCVPDRGAEGGAFEGGKARDDG
jgi:hypothetical protein